MNLDDLKLGLNGQFFLISGPCVIESKQLCFDIAGQMKEITDDLNLKYVFKASYDKANRSSVNAFRGVGLEKGLEILQSIKIELDVPVLTDVHNESEINEVSSVVDIIQTPAFLCRQTNFIRAVAKTKKIINIKKGQFLSPYEMFNVVQKAQFETENKNIMVCERGTSFGYNNLVSDMRSLEIMKKTGCPVIFDATHSVQLPGGMGNKSGGQSEFVPVLSKAAMAVGIDGIFMETHPNPLEALSDGPNSLPLSEMKKLLTKLIKIDHAVKNDVVYK